MLRGELDNSEGPYSYALGQTLNKQQGAGARSKTAHKETYMKSTSCMNTHAPMWKLTSIEDLLVQ